MQEKIQEMTKAIKVNENLEKLESYVKKQLQENTLDSQQTVQRSKSRTDKQKRSSMNRSQQTKYAVENTSFNVNIFNRFSKDNTNVQSAGQLNQVIFNI